MAYTKRCRKRKLKDQLGIVRLKAAHIRYPKTRSFYHRTLRSLRRFPSARIKRVDTNKLLQQHIASLLERHLPLIKRQSIKLYSNKSDSRHFNPKTLKGLVICFINSEVFRSKLLRSLQIQEEDKFISNEVKQQNQKEGSNEKAVNGVCLQISRVNEHDNEFQLEKRATDLEDTTNEHSVQLQNESHEYSFLNSVTEVPIIDRKDMKENVNDAFDDLKNTDNTENAIIDVPNDETNAIKSNMSTKNDGSKTESISIDSGILNSLIDDNAYPCREIDILQYPVPGETYKISESKFNISDAEETDLIEQLKKQYTDGYIDASDTDCSVNIFGELKSPKSLTTSSKNDFHNDEESRSSTESSSTSDSDCSSGNISDRSSTTSSSSDEDSRSNTTAEKSDFNEMKELEKELSQHQNDERADMPLDGAKSKLEANIEYGRNEKYHIPDNAITENDITTLKQILESDSDEHEETERKRSNVDDTAEANENVSAKQTTKAGTERSRVVDNETTVNDDNIVIVGEVDLKLPIVICDDNVGRGNKCEVTSGEVKSDKICERENLVNGLETEINQFPSEIVCPVTVEAGAKSVVPSLKKLVQDFVERQIWTEDHSIPSRTEDALNSKIPKLSDLCKIALNSSFEISANAINQNSSDTLENDLSVEEALAEMYRQAGVASDNEDDAGGEKEAEDLLLINLQEILVNDSDLYVLQCDINENVLSVVAHANTAQLTETVEESTEAPGDDEHTEDAMKAETGQQELKVTDHDADFVRHLQTIYESESEAMVTTTTDPHTLVLAEDEVAVVNEQSFCDDSFNPQFDLPAIHHEEIVSHDYRRLKRQLLYNSLREKYVLRRVNSRQYHGNRVLKKYIHRWILQCLIASFRERELRKALTYE